MNKRKAPLLAVEHLNVAFSTLEGEVRAVNDLSFTLRSGETLGIVGESGSGKSQMVYAIVGLLAKNGRATGSVFFEGHSLLNLPDRELNRFRGNAISIIFQDSMTALNPYLTIGDQLMEILMHHKHMSRVAAFMQSLQMLDAVKISEAKKRMKRYPHELSGGMRQRVMIAMSLLCEPKLLIADEPTTALDVTVQAQILALLTELKKDFDTSIMLITHDLGVVAGICDHVLVMYAGNAVEYGAVDDIFYQPSHPYTLGLLQTIPNLDSEMGSTLPTIPGNPPNLLALPAGCAFAPRCPWVGAECHHSSPQLISFAAGRSRACFRERALIHG